MPAAADVRLLRAAVFAAACVALAAAGHLAAAGSGVALWALAVGWAVLFVVSVPLAGRERRSLPAIAAVLATGQITLHILFNLGRHGGLPDIPGGTGGPMELAARLLCNGEALRLTPAEAERIILAAGLDPASGGAPHYAAPEPTEALFDLLTGPMLLGHLLAALAAGWLLRSGEVALWRLIRLSARTLPPTLRLAMALFRALIGTLLPAPAAPVRPGPTSRPGIAATSGTVLPDSVIRRGPPQHCALTLVA